MNKVQHIQYKGQQPVNIVAREVDIRKSSSPTFGKVFWSDSYDESCPLRVSSFFAKAATVFMVSCTALLSCASSVVLTWASKLVSRLSRFT